MSGAENTQSKWLMIDMHMHSKSSAIMKPGESRRLKEMSATEYVDILINYGVEVFSITDHDYFNSEYYESICEDIESRNLCISAIPGAELDVYAEMKDSEPEMLHMCVYFNKTVNPPVLQETIDALYEDNAKPSFERVINALREIKTDFIVIPHGNKEKGILKNRLFERLAPFAKEQFHKYAAYKIFRGYDVSPGFYGKGMDFWASNFAEETKKYDDLISGLDDNQISEMQKSITEKIKGESTPLTDKEQIIYSFIKKYGSYFAYFSFSDWHNGEKYSPELNNFIYGSIDTAFESFAMATLDPESRIITTKEKTIRLSGSILENVSFIQDGHKNTVRFTPGLNVIVGKRNSGKSLLVSVLRDLHDKDAKDGAIKKYKNLSVGQVSAQDRNGVKMGPGDLGSVSFLNQDKINSIFESPDEADKDIKNKFEEAEKIDLSDLRELIEVGKKITPYDRNYKNISSSIVSIRNSKNYSFARIKDISDAGIINGFSDALDALKDVKNEIAAKNLDLSLIDKALEETENARLVYDNLIKNYNLIFHEANTAIIDINNKSTDNQKIVNSSMINIRNAVEQISKNFERQLRYLEFTKILDTIKISNPPIKAKESSGYLFVTKYAIPADFTESLKEKIDSTIKKAAGKASKGTNKVSEYMNGDCVLRDEKESIVSELAKYYNSSSISTPKYEFYKIIDRDKSYGEIKTTEELDEVVGLGSLRNLTDSSPGEKSVAYLDMMFDLDSEILVLDQPEDNIDNDYISQHLVPNIKATKKDKQLIFVTHNPSVAIYGDAFNYIYVTKDNEGIKYKNYIIESINDREQIINILEGGRASFSNRNKKYGDILGEEEYAN